MLKKFGKIGLACLIASMGAGTMAVAQEAYVVGMSALITGQGASSYAATAEATRLYFEEVNGRGGINGHPVRLLIEDNSSSPTEASVHTKKFLNQDGAILVMNVGLSSTFAPMIKEAKRAGAVVFFAGSVCPREVYPPADPMQACSTYFASGYDAQFVLDYIKASTPGEVKLGLVSMAIPVSRGEVDNAEKQARTMGMTPVSNQSVPPPTADYTPYATKIKESGANWVFSWAPWPTEIKTLLALRKIGWRGKYAAAGFGLSEAELAKLKDDDFYVMTGNAFFRDDLPIHREITAVAEKRGAAYPAKELAEGWAGAMVLEQILANVSWPPTREKVLDAINNINVDFKGLRGANLVWTKDNHFRTTQSYRLYRWDSSRNDVIQVQDWTMYAVK